MTRDQGIWLGGGVAFGFVAGFVLAYALTADTRVGQPAAVAAAPAGQAAAAAGQEDPHIDVRGLLDDLNHRLEENPQDLQVLAQLAEIYMQAGMADQALEFIDRMDEVEPDRFQTRLMRAMALQSLGREEEFSSQVVSMTEDYPDRWEAHYLMAAHLISHHHNDGDFAIAREALNRIEELRPGMPETEQLRMELENAESSHEDGGVTPG